MATSPSNVLNFEAFLSRDYKPARLSLLRVREKYHPPENDSHGSKQPRPAAPAGPSNALKRRQECEETSRLVLQLVTQTDAFTRHLADKKQAKVRSELLTKQHPTSSAYDDPLPSAFHEIELSDWESKINWEGISEEEEKEPKSSPIESGSTALALLRRPRNPLLDNITFDESTVSWDGDVADLLEKASKAPLILELGVAGRSVANVVYRNTVLNRPTPAVQSAAYQKRVERDWSKDVTSTAELSKNTLHADKDQMEKFIEARQKKRAQMAKDKTNRVKEAMGTLALGGGRGRTITSSLMGPGGTERTGRPSRHMNSSAVHDTEYIEQLDMVNSHTLVRDLSKIMQRQFHRPKLPQSVVRPDMAWQFQIRYMLANKKSEPTGNAASYHAIIMGSHSGAISKAKLRTEADLSPTEGKMVLLEYCEEFPPLQLSKGMASKIINYYKGDRSRCPVSAGGGDRPARRKRAGDTSVGNSARVKSERPPRLTGPATSTSILDWVGELPKKTKHHTEKEEIDVLPEGKTEILHSKVHGPFIGEIEEGTTVTALISNLFVAPMFRHEPDSTDFLMILTPPGGASRPGQRESMGVVLREIPSSMFTIGQTEPRTRVHAPNSQGEKNFLGPFVSYQIAKALTRAQAREGHGLRFDELQERVLPNLELPGNALRQRLKQVAIYDKNTSIWAPKAIGFEDYPGVEALGKAVSPEGVAAFETACAASRRLLDLGLHQFLEKGSHSVVSIGVTMVYLAGQLNAARELARKTKKLGEISRSTKNIQAVQASYYERAAEILDIGFRVLRQKYEVSQFIYEELQLAPWHLTGEFIEVHKKAEGTGMMKLTGLGDPSGQGEGISFLREADTKPTKAVVGEGEINAQVKKITGTEDDLRKLTMKQMANILRKYGMGQKQIDTLKRWDRVHVIRDLCTKAASDGVGDGYERFARGEKMKLSEQKQVYRERIQTIWKRQIAALSATDPNDRAVGADMAGGSGDAIDTTVGPQAAQKKKSDMDDDSDSDSDDDDLAATFEEEMMDRSEANQLVATHTRAGDTGGLGQLRAATHDQDLTKDARELAALKRQREEERAAQEGMESMRKQDDAILPSMINRKVIRKKITKTHPDGRQVTTFKFIVHPEEVGKIMARLQQRPESEREIVQEKKYEYGIDEKPPGHAMFEDEDDFEYSSKGRLAGSRRGTHRKRGDRVRTASRNSALQLGKLKTRISKEERMRKRKREEEELEVYATSAKRKGTSNRRERGSIRERRPHVIFAEKLEAIRAAVESRELAGPFMKPVNRRNIPSYYEVISHPIDLQTIRDKIKKYEYRTADAFVQDFDLMKKNAIKFNGESSMLAQEAIAIYDLVKSQVDARRSEWTTLEDAVNEQLNGKPKKKKKLGSSKASSGDSGSNVANVGGVSVNLGDISTSMHFHGSDSDSDESISLEFN